MTLILLYSHPDGEGCIEFDGRKIIASTDTAATTTEILIGPGGMRDLARRLASLADVLDGGLC